MVKETQVKGLNGYPLFHDVEDKELQSRNRAVILANIIEDNLYEDSGTITQAGMVYSLRYWDAIDEADRPAIYTIFEQEVNKRKLIPGGI